MILFSFCSCFHYENVDFVHLYIAFLTPPSPRVTNTFYNTPWLMVLWQNMTWHICNNVKNNNIKCEWFLSVNSYTSITNARHLSSSSCPHGSVVATSLSVKLFVSVDILPPHPPHPVCEYVNENMPLHCALTHTHSTHTHHSIYHCFALLSSSCVFFVPTILCSALSCTHNHQAPPCNTHELKNT